MSVTKEQKSDLVKKFGGAETNTGSAEAQVAILSARIADLTEHFKTNKKDHHSRRGLLQLVGRRRRLLDYVKSRDIEKYRTLISELGLRR